MSMIGKRDSPGMSTKAAETEGLLEFVHGLLKTHMDQFVASGATDEIRQHIHLSAKLLLAASTSAMDFEALLKNCKRNVPLETQEQLLVEYKRFNVLFSRAGGHLNPKNHLMLHLIQGLDFHGNARYYHTYNDESFNGVIARIARSCHRLCWSEVIFRKVFTASLLELERRAGLEV